MQPFSNFKATIGGNDYPAKDYAAYDELDTRFGMIGAVGRNAIINGDMEIARRATSFAAVVSGAYTLDRWVWGKAGAAVHTVSQDIDVPTVAEAGRLFTHSLEAALTTPDDAIAASDFSMLQQYIEGYNIRGVAQRSFTISFWVKSGKTGIYCVSAANKIADRSCVQEYTINSANTWEKKTVTFPASPSAGTWDYTNNIGMRISFPLAVGATYQTASGAWAAGEFYATANQVNATATGSGNFLITGVQLEAGDIATEIESRSYQHELMLCQRYLPCFNEGANCKIALGQATSTTQGQMLFEFPVETRVPVTGIVASAAANWSVADNAWSFGANQIVSALTFQQGNSKGATVTATATGASFAAGDATMLVTRFAASIYFTGAEL